MAGRLRGKTGTLTGVRALVGILPGDGAPDVRFAMVLNSPDAARLKRLSFGMRLIALLPDSKGRQPNAPWGGVCLFSRQG